MLCSGQIADFLGRRNTIIVGLVISFAAITMEFVATTSPLFFGGKFCNGFAVGIIQAAAGTYIGEVSSALHLELHVKTDGHRLFLWLYAGSPFA